MQNDLENIFTQLRNLPMGSDRGSGATEQQICEAEKDLDCIFPIQYRQFLSTIGWCSLGPHEVFGLGNDIPDFLNVIMQTLFERKLSPNIGSHVAIFNDGGGNIVWLNCLRGAIVQRDHDTGQIVDLDQDFLSWISK